MAEETKYKIRWMGIAVARYEETIAYLEERWPESVVADFIFRVQKALNTMERNPHRFRLSEYWGIREAILHRNCLLIFRFQGDQGCIELLTFFDTRQNPAKKGLFYGKM